MDASLDAARKPAGSRLMAPAVAARVRRLRRLGSEIMDMGFSFGFGSQTVSSRYQPSRYEARQLL
jgi:hypothetical protein